MITVYLTEVIGHGCPPDEGKFVMSVIDHLLTASNLLAKQKQELSLNLSSRWNAVSEKMITFKSDYRLDNFITFPIKQAPISENVRDAYTAIREHIGTGSVAGNWFEITQTQIDQFAAITQDKQWIHVDAERSKRESPYRSTIAHGFLILSMIPHLLPEQDVEKIIGQPIKLMINSGLENVRFLRPVKPGTKIRARREYVGVQILRKGIRITDRVTLETSPERAICQADFIYILSL